ncbi:MAG: hypothetical protein M0R06_09870 [Sphaerochaeta sp.]|jgi:hypothetical protein|nr:hypothetical protein [Sphaerochaeta sp.]
MSFLNRLNRAFYALVHERVPGLIEEKDSRTFGARVIAGEITADDLIDVPFTNAPNLVLIDQKGTDFCVGAGKAYHKQNTEGQLMSWAGAFALGCKAQGYVGDWGISILQVMRGAQKYGTPEEAVWPFKGNRNDAAAYGTMSAEVLENAARHKDGSFFAIELPRGWDQFDAFRAYLNKFRESKAVIQTGADGHNITLIGQVKSASDILLYGPDSYGLRAGQYRLGVTKDGYRYFTRKEVNQMFTGYMAFDLPRAVAELLNAYDHKAVKLQDHNNCYVVYEGKKHLLKNELTAWAYGVLLPTNGVYLLHKDEFDLIPTGSEAIFDGGPHAEAVRRALRYVGKEQEIVKD